MLNHFHKKPAATEPVTGAAPVLQNNSTPVISPRMTRSRKKRKAASSASPADGSVIEQVDGPAPSPPSSPEEPRPGSALSSPTCARTPTLAPLRPRRHHQYPHGPGSYQTMVICRKCLAGCHGLGFQMCHSCFDKGR